MHSPSVRDKGQEKGRVSLFGIPDREKLKTGTDFESGAHKLILGEG